MKKYFFIEYKHAGIKSIKVSTFYPRFLFICFCVILTTDNDYL